jgi:alcohol dehydrogenase class IV
MKRFNYIQPTEILFGCGRLAEIGSVTAGYGSSALLVMDKALMQFLPKAVKTVEKSLTETGLKFVIFDKVQPNPVIDDVQEGAKLARKIGADVVVGFGGGSTMDTARAIAVAATHPGTAMDYLYFSRQQPTEKTLPIVQIPTTSGTGSHVSCCAVITDPARKFKSALWNQNRLFAKAAIVDPELMLSVPPAVTASTGFDVFTHAFESYINVNSSPYTDMLALESIRIVTENLPKVYVNGSDVEGRSRMAYVDTLAGMCIANSGTTLPHAMGQPISGHYPKVSHGQSLAVVYPAFIEYTADAAVEKFAVVARLFNPELKKQSDSAAAVALKDQVIRLLKQIGMYLKFDDFGITRGDLEPILSHCMEFPDVKVNPKAPDKNTVRNLYMKCFK